MGDFPNFGHKYHCRHDGMLAGKNSAVVLKSMTDNLEDNSVNTSENLIIDNGSICQNFQPCITIIYY